jgi:adenine-specific DNA-methyltransferase
VHHSKRSSDEKDSSPIPHHLHGVVLYHSTETKLLKKPGGDDHDESGSIFVQIGDENVHLVRCLMDEVFGRENFVSEIVFEKTGYLGSQYIDANYDFLLWYAREKNNLKFRQLLGERDLKALSRYNYIELPDGTDIKLAQEQLNGTKPMPEGKRWRDKSLFSEGETKGSSSK